MKFFRTALIACTLLLPVSAIAQEQHHSEAETSVAPAPIEPPTEEAASPDPINPFIVPVQQLQTEQYDGAFSSDTVKLSLAKFGERFLGELFYVSTGQTYSVDGVVAEDGFSGTFNTGTSRFDFTFALNEAGDTGMFQTSGFESELRKDGVSAAPPPAEPTAPVTVPEPEIVEPIAPPVAQEIITPEPPQPDQPQPLHVLQGHWDNVNDVAFSPDGKYLATGSDDAKVIVWNVNSGSKKLTVKSHKSSVQAVTFSPDSKYLHSVSEANVSVNDAFSGGTVVRTQVKNGKEKYAHTSLSTGYTDINFSPDGKSLVKSWLNSKSTVYIVNTQDDIRKELEGHTETVMSAEFSPDGHSILTNALDKRLGVWNAKTGDMRFIIKAPVGENSSVADSFDDATFSPDGRYIASIQSGTLDIWNARNGKKIRNILEGTDENLDIYEVPFAIAWHPNGKLIAIGSSNGNVYVLDAETGEVRSLLTGVHTDQVRTIAFNYDGSLLASGSFDDTAVIWKLD